MWHYVQQLPYMRKANIKRAKASKYRASQQPKREANPEEWLQGTNFAKVGTILTPKPYTLNPIP